jgi:hypothetical protein
MRCAAERWAARGGARCVGRAAHGIENDLYDTSYRGARANGWQGLFALFRQCSVMVGWPVFKVPEGPTWRPR